MGETTTSEPEHTDAEAAHRKPRRLPAGTHDIHFQIDDLKRRYLLHVPASINADAPTPLILFLHGGGGHAQASVRETRWNEKAEAEGFLVAYLEGMPFDRTRPGSFRTNPRVWNDGSPRTGLFLHGVDDVAYVCTVLDDIGARFAVDPARIYVTGFSNGAGMTFRVAVELSERIAAIGCIAAYFYLENPVQVDAVPLIYFIGTEDPMIPHMGGVSVSPWGDVPDKRPVRVTVEKYAHLLGCPPEPKTIRNEAGVLIDVYGPGRDGSEAIFYTVQDMGHLWPGGDNLLPAQMVGRQTNKIVANDLIWDFFLKHPKRTSK